jgi:hypothetical protein
MLGTLRKRPDVTEPVLRNYIGGRWQASKSSVLLDVEDPAEAAVIAKVPVSTAEEVDAAVGAAGGAFRSGGTSRRRSGAALFRLANPGGAAESSPTITLRTKVPEECGGASPHR